jgi:hypothetical protein
MDTLGRRKTAIAGTFAIACKSLSNSHPISAAEARSSVASAKGGRHGHNLNPAAPGVRIEPHSVSRALRLGAARPTCDQALRSSLPAPRGFTRALLRHLQHSLSERCGRLEGGWGPPFPEISAGDGRGENRRRKVEFPFPPRCFPFFLTQNFGVTGDHFSPQKSPRDRGLALAGRRFQLAGDLARHVAGDPARRQAARYVPDPRFHTSQADSPAIACTPSAPTSHRRFLK